MNNLSKVNYTTIDLAKFIFSIFIVMLHLHVADLSDASWFYNNFLFRIAVPFFFVASGYFYGRKIDVKKRAESYKCLLRFLKRLLLPYCFWLLLNIALVSIKLLMAGKSILSIILFVGHSTLVYPVGALWYVYACMLGAIILYILQIRLKLNLNLILVIAILLYSFALVANSYYWVIKDSFFCVFVDYYIQLFNTARNGLFVGFPIMFLGYYIAQNESNFCFLTINKIIVPVCILSFFVSMMESYLNLTKPFVDEASLYIGYLFFIPSFFILMKNCSINISDKFSLYLRNLSAGIYFSHRALYYIELIIISILNIKENYYVSFFIVISSSLILCLFSYKHGGFFKRVLS